MFLMPAVATGEDKIQVTASDLSRLSFAYSIEYSKHIVYSGPYGGSYLHWRDVASFLLASQTARPCLTSTIGTS